MERKPTLARVEETIDRYLFKDSEPIVLAITGGWGEGKTHFWKNHILPKHEEFRPGYISVFGADSLSTVRERVLVTAGETLDVRDKSISDIVKDRFPWVRQIGHVLAGIGKHWSGVIGVPDSVVDQLLESTLLRENWVLCIDDVERLSDKIGTDTFLGYVNEPRDEHRLKVVLIFNDDWFEESDDEEFARYREKVIDREVPFVPDLSEIVQLVASEEIEAGKVTPESLVERCSILGLTNIRVLAKAIRYYRDVTSILPEDRDLAFCDHAMHSLLLYCSVRFGADKVISFEDLGNFSLIGRSMTRHALESDGEDADDDVVEKILGEYNYQTTDDLDLILIDFVKTDILDGDSLIEEYDKHINRTSRGILEERFRNTWKEHFHGTLKDNAHEFCDELVAATDAYLAFISVEQIDSVAHILTRLGRINDSERLFRAYMSSHPGFYREHQEMASFAEPIKYPAMKSALESAAKEEKRDERSLMEVLRSAWADEFIDQDDRKRLAQFSGTEVAEALLDVDEPSITSKVRALRRMSRQGASEEDEQIATALAEAIEIIANQSTVNRLRMEAMQLISRDDAEQGASR